MFALQPPDSLTMTEAEYLVFADASEGRYEYSHGQVHAMTGGTFRHGTISANIITHLNNLLRDHDCATTTPDVRVHVAPGNAYRYPDVVVVCGPPAYFAGREDTITNPILLVEVLSPSTALFDHNDKLREYTGIASLSAYLLVAQETARVERYLRHDDGQWLYQAFSGLDAEVPLPLAALGVEITLRLAEVYRRIAWAAGEA